MHGFFQVLRSEKLVKKYCFQWMTDVKYDELKKNSDKASPIQLKTSKSDGSTTKLEISTYYEPLLEELGRVR